MTRARAILLTILFLGSACTTRPSDLEGARPTVTLEPPESSESWREVARAPDRDRLARLDTAWQAALAG
jgi:starvation-inducible outer membrane lipoprotein